jgi:predicted amidophosphoribosyltransferase
MMSTLEQPVPICRVCGEPMDLCGEHKAGICSDCLDLPPQQLVAMRKKAAVRAVAA